MSSFLILYKYSLNVYLTACLGPLALGLNIGWSSSVQYQLSFEDPSTNEIAGLVVLDESEWTWVVSLLILGALAGALCAGYVVDRIGRKNGFLLSCIPFVIGSILIIAAQNPGKRFEQIH